MKDEFDRKVVFVCLDPEDKHPLFVFDTFESLYQYCKNSNFEIRNNPTPGGHYWFEYSVWDTKYNRPVGWCYKTVVRF